MMVRIVRMEFAPEKVETFKKLFNETYERIRNFDGCRFLELYEDSPQANIFYTVSKWDNENKLEIYRNSTLFRETWKVTKSCFSAPPLAYSLVKKVEDLTNPF
jgi:autoinducer 2-degrading protein